MTQATVSLARALFLVALATFPALLASQLDAQCAAGVCEQPVEALEEDDFSLLSLTTQVHTRSHRKEQKPAQEQQEQKPAQPPVAEVRPRAQSRKHVAVGPFVAQDAAPPTATEEFEAEEAEEDALHRGQYEERRPRTEEDPPPGQSEEAPRRRPPHHSRAAPLPPTPEPAVAEPVAADPSAEAEDSSSDELAPDEGDEEPGMAWSGAEVYLPAHHRKRQAAPPASQVPEPREQAPQAAVAGVAGVASASLPKAPLSSPSQPIGSSLKALWAGNVEAPIPLLIIGVVFFAGIGAFLLHEITERTRRQKMEARAAHVATPPIEPRAMDSSFLFHVLNCVESEKDRRAAPTTELLSKAPQQKAVDDSSDDCSACPHPEKEPESEYDDGEDVLGKLQEADWALQIAYYEALQRRNESPGGRQRSGGGSGPAHHSRSSSKRHERQDALAAKYQARAEALRARGPEER